MAVLPEPGIGNDYLADHVSLLLRSYRNLTEKNLLPPLRDAVELARQANDAPLVLLSHNGSEDPILTYGNKCALDLFKMPWEVLVKTPSRFTAEAPNRAERERLLQRVTVHGYIGDYSGIRIAADGRRFQIHQASVWNVHNLAGEKIGQAASFSNWEFVE